MDDNAKPSKLIQLLLFGGAMLDREKVEQSMDELDRETRSKRYGETGCKKPSTYVEEFEAMVNAVFEREKHLLAESELDMCARFAEACYNTRYFLTKLVLRKPNQWHAASALLKYIDEIGDKGFKQSFADLCQPFCDGVDFDSVKSEDFDIKLRVKQEETDDREIIDLTGDSDDEEATKVPVTHFAEESMGSSVKLEAGPSNWNLDAVPGPSRLGSLQWVDEAVGSVISSNSTELGLDVFCEDETNMTIHEILSRLNNDKLKELVKSRKCKPAKTTKSDMISALLYHASTQTTLGFAPTPSRKGKARDDGLRQSILPFTCSSRHPQNGDAKKMAIEKAQQRLRVQALELLGKCIRVKPEFYRLIRRLHIIRFRSTELPTSLLLPALLTKFNKRTYPEYKHARNGSIWQTRDDLLRYEDALLLEAKVDKILEIVDQSPKSGATKTSGPQNQDKFVTPATPGLGRNMSTPLKTPRSASSLRVPDTPGSAILDHGVHDTGVGDDVEESEAVKDTPTVQKARLLKYIYYKWVRPKWEEAVAVKKQERESERTPGLERFEPGFVYTRMVCKAAAALGTLKEYEAELEVIQALLSQRLWCRGKRATWYIKRTILLDLYLSKVPDGDSKTKDMNILRQAMEGIHEALKDEDTGIVWRPDLVRRLRRLENKLNVPEPERAYIVGGELRKAEIVMIGAIQVKHTSTSLAMDTACRPIGKEYTHALGANIKAHFSPVVERTKSEGAGNVEVKTEPGTQKKKGQKTIWKGRNGEELSVEDCALQHYEDLGFKGFHSETSILTTIFALVFWDVIFADVPGAFETPFQSAPLDIGEDSFYYARKESIEVRLAEVKEGKAREILEKNDEKYREKDTWCIGLKWDICSRADLVEIVGCLGGESLAIICRLFCEDYVGRSSGAPDLIVWNAEKGICMFAEVKGPGDTLMENQKLWLHSLLGANAAVEECRVYDNSPEALVNMTTKRKRKTPSASTSKWKAKPKSNADLEMDAPEEEEYHDQLDVDPDKLPAAPPSRPRKRRRTAPTQLDDDETSMPYPPTATPPTPPPRASQRATRNSNEVEGYLETPVPLKKRKVMSPLIP